jgi:hypothetical protein
MALGTLSEPLDEAASHKNVSRVFLKELYDNLLRDLF